MNIPFIPILCIITILTKSLFQFQILHSTSRLFLAISHSGNIFIYCLSSSSFRRVLYNKIFFKTQDPFELSNPLSPYERNYNGPSREDTVCISFLQSSRHNSTVSQLNTLNAVNLPSPRSEDFESSSGQKLERRHTFFDCQKLFKSKAKENGQSFPIDDMSNPDDAMEMQPPNGAMEMQSPKGAMEIQPSDANI